MHPIKRALNSWKKRNNGGTDRDFAAFVGYSHVDAIYKQIRGEYLPPFEKAARMAGVIGWSAGKFVDACASHLKQERRPE